MKIDCGNADIPPYFKSDELTSRNSAKEIKLVLERLANKFTNEDCFDYILASNMLSVGIDIDRLGVMCVYGQPKSNSEYIQASSRVGRTNPGLVISLYNNMRSRDKSYYEQFCYYHLNYAACHDCTLLPETSCERFNCFLDRASIVGLPDNPDLGFFLGNTAQ